MKPQRLEGRGKAVWGARIKLALALTCAVSVTSCSKLIRTGQSPNFLSMQSLQGAPGTSGSFGGILQSDVLNFNPATGVASIASDQGQAALRLTPRDPQMPAWRST